MNTDVAAVHGDILPLNSRWDWRYICTSGGRRCCRVKVIGEMWIEVKMESLIFAFCVVLALGDPRAQTKVWQPAPGHTQIPIWPGIEGTS
jgi:hypothetical protein